jgi:TPR repeat protein
MNYIREKSLALIVLLLTSTAGSTQYLRQPWATVSKEQAEAECYNYINSAAGRGSNLYLCMKAKGYDETDVPQPAAPRSTPPPPAQPARLSAADLHAKGMQALRSGQESQAVDWFRESAIQGNAPAQASLAAMYHLGKGGLPKDDAQAVWWFRRAAMQGHALAQAMLGVMHENGMGGLPRDSVQAVEWYRKSAAQGNETAKEHLRRLGIN